MGLRSVWEGCYGVVSLGDVGVVFLEFVLLFVFIIFGIVFFWFEIVFVFVIFFVE